MIVSSFSCSYNIPDDTKVYIIGVGINYQQTGNYLRSAPSDDIMEFASLYKHILDSKNIPNETYLMVNSAEIVLKADGTPNWDETKKQDDTDYNSPYAPTITNFEALIDNLANGSNGYPKVRENDLVMFLYSGHGATDAVPNGIKKGAFCFIKRNQSSDGSIKNSIDELTHIRFANSMSKFKSPVMLIIDSCYSGHIISAVNSGNVGEGTKDDTINDYGGVANYVATFKDLVKVPNITALVAATASQKSWQQPIGFNGEVHGLFMGNTMKDLGWTHTHDEVFTTIPEYSYDTDDKTNIHSSLSKPYNVYGTAMPYSYYKDQIITSRDLYNNGKTYQIGIYDQNSDTKDVCEQRSLLSLGPCDLILAW